MKRLIFFIAMAILLSGCAHTASKSYWVKDGEWVSSEQAQREFAQCRGPLWSKAEMTDYEKDYRLCAEADMARDKHIKDTNNILLAGQILTFGLAPVSIAFGIAGIFIPSNSDYFRRCMASKGYSPTETRAEELDRCMKDKGYEWRE